MLTEVGEEVRVDVGIKVVVPVEAKTFDMPSEPVGEEVRVEVGTEVVVSVEAKTFAMPSKPVANKTPPDEPACQGRTVIEPASS